MTLGERLKQLRADKNWTQPQAAEAIGIEQSYLSKLENDRSLPSAEIFTAILNSFSLDAQKFLEGIDLSRLDRHLLQIPAIASCLANNQKMRTSSIKRWLYCSALACIFGLTAFTAGHLGLIFANKQYNYFSPGIVKPGESQWIFDNWKRAIETQFGPDSSAAVQKIMSDKNLEMYHRLAEDYILTNDYKGKIFVLPVEGGSRTYKLMKQSQEGKKVLRKENRLLMLLGLLLTFSGLTGFFVEHRLRRASSH